MSVMLLVAVLAVWRLTHLLHAEDGPWDVFARLRQAVGTGVLGAALDCFYCLSLWVAAPVALVLDGALHEKPLLWLALSGGAILLERVSAPLPTFHEDPVAAPASCAEVETLSPRDGAREHSEKESLDVLLRKDA